MRTFSREDLLELAGRKSYARGVDYVSQVTGLTVDGNTVRATVTGTHSYRVELTPGRRGLVWDCDCPWAEEGNFCKHCVALGLVHLYNLEHGVEVPSAPDTRAYLESLGHGELVDLVLEAAAASPGLRRRLEMRAASSGDEVDTASLRVMVDSALRTVDLVDYGEARGYADAVHGVADELANLLERGMAAEAEELGRRAIELLDEHGGMVDDSDGGVGEAAHRFVEIHVGACAEAGVDRERLADWLLDRQLNGASGVPELLVETYADALGEDGLRHYGQELARIRSQRPEGDWTARFLMTEFARVAGDTDLLVRTYAADPGHVHYSGIVRALDEAGRRDEALEWALRGLAEDTGRLDERLVDYAIDAYRDAGRDEEVQRLRWEVFERSPQVRTYQSLRADTPEH
uniref:SWIM zinc finger family protein n=1 Tax=Nocardiopsis lucentensis TaxID=53441 RepID=UPI0003748431